MGLISWILRFLGCLVLAAGTVLAVGDVARSLASDRVRLMTITQAMETVGASGFVPAPEPGLSSGSGVFAADGRGGDLAAVVGRQPASIVLGLTGLALLAIGRPSRRDRRVRNTGTTRN